MKNLTTHISLKNELQSLHDCIIEKLSIGNSSLSKQYNKRTRIPNTISYQDKTIFNRIYGELKKIAKSKNITTNDSFDELERYCYDHMPKSLQTKEKIWAYISIILGYDYMYDEEDEDYLDVDWEEQDPIIEFVHRAVYDVESHF